MHFFKTPLWKIFVGPKYRNCRYIFAILIPHLLTALLEGASFALILMAFSSIEKNAVSEFSSLSLSFVGQLLSSMTGMQLFYFFILGAIFLQAFRSLVSYLALHGTLLLSLKIQIEAQKSVYRQIFRFTYPFISQFKMGDLSEYIKNPSTSVPTFFDCLNRFLVSLFMIIGLIGVLSWISPILTVLTVILFGIFAFAQKKLIKKVTQHSVQLTSHLFEFSHQTVQSLQGIRPIYIFQRQKYILQKNEHLLNLISRYTRKVYSWSNVIPTINETVNVLLVGTILVLGSWVFSQNGQALLSSLLTYIALTYRLATRLQMCMGALSTIGIHYGSLLRLNAILDDQNKEFAPVVPSQYLDWNRGIEFKEVALLYPGANKPALQGVSFSIQKGTTTAFVGLSGAGKSSILDLILGLQKPVKGTILIDSQDLASISSESWLNKIGMVSQDTFIFNDTIEENIRFGDPHATDSDIRRACDLAEASDFIAHLPHGLKTVIGERGYKLSGGERQRIALARALLKNPEILILDEATSNLDSHSERRIQNALGFLQKNKTLIIVAHRLSTIVHADQIIVLENGEIIEKGAHEELVAKNGRYAKLWEIQSERMSAY
jgi:ATP-binding cassette subfamily B protein/subfamily B ATP-binding cassette protein MsbA